jgi:putative endonuclease
MQYVYVLQSEQDDYLYIGCTNNLKNRLAEHNAGQNESTKSKKPFKIIYYEAFLDKNDAYAREKVLKQKWGRKFLERVLKRYFNKK